MTKMNLGTPPELKILLETRGRIVRQRAKNDIARREAELRTQADIDRLRIERFDELWKASEAVFGWRDWLAEAEIGRELFRLYGDDVRLKLYVGKYWLGEPTKPTDRVCYGILYLRGDPLVRKDPAFIYEETHKGQTSRSVDISDIAGLVSSVHPDFLVEAHRHLFGPDSWNYILDGLDPDRHRKPR